MKPEIVDAIRRVNYRRRTRRITESDVVQVLAEARDDGYGWMVGGKVAKAYDYPASTAAVAAIRLDKHTFAVRVGSCDAHRDASPVTWFGPSSKLDNSVCLWLNRVREDRKLLGAAWILLTRAEVLGMLRPRDEAIAKAVEPIIATTVPDVLITVEDSLNAGNCPRVTERVARAFEFQPTNARTVARRFPSLLPFVRRAAQRAEQRGKP